MNTRDCQAAARDFPGYRLLRPREQAHRGYYFEFGCFEANTMRLAFDCFHHLFDWHYVAFDSFEGLPEIGEIDKQAIWEKASSR